MAPRTIGFLGTLCGGLLFGALIAACDGGGGADDSGATKTISTGSSGTLTAPSGATLEVPVGAVPLTADGTEGSLKFSLKDDVSPPSTTAPEGMTLGDTVVELGPDEITFQRPVTLTLPVPDGNAPGLSLATWDEAAASWVRVASRVDNDAGTVAGDIQHLSLWSWLYYSGPMADWADQYGWGTVYFHVPCTTAPATACPGYLVCIDDFTLTDPEMDGDFDPADALVTISTRQADSTGMLQPLWGGNLVPRGVYDFQVTRLDPETGMAVEWTNIVPPLEVAKHSPGMHPGEAYIIDLNQNTLDPVPWNPGAAPCLEPPTTLPGGGGGGGGLGSYKQGLASISFQEQYLWESGLGTENKSGFYFTVDTANGGFTGNTFSGTWTIDAAPFHSEGTLTATLDAGQTRLVEATLTGTVTDDVGGASMETYSFTIADVPRVDCTATLNTLCYKVTGATACDHFIEMTREVEGFIGDGAYSSTLTGWTCDADAEVHIEFFPQ